MMPPPPSRRHARGAGAAALLGALALPAGGAWAQATQDGETSVQRFEPVPGPRNYFTVAGGRTQGEWNWSAGLFFDYARSPFVLRSCVSATSCDDPAAQQQGDVNVVQDMFTWNLMGSVTPIPRLQIGLRFPVVFVSGDGFDATTGLGSQDGLASLGAGDPVLEGKVRIYGEPADMVVLAAAADLSAPLGVATAEGSYIGNDSPVTGGIRGIVDVKVGDFTFAANLRGVFRQDATIGNTSVGPELRYGAAGAYHVNESFRVLLEGFGGTRFSSRNGTNSLELAAGVQLAPPEVPLQFTLGGGAGVVQGIGVPAARGFAAITFVMEPTDLDGDGIPDEDDKCPTRAEDYDGIQDEDGCPEDDADFDGILDGNDRCPLQPENLNGFEDEDGCPDTPPDRDGDTYPDSRDACPTVYGTYNRAPYVGCPDTDGDLVPDQFDKCLDSKEDFDGFQDDDGCADPDNDNDGVPDAFDKCDGEAEIFNGFEDDDGCPDVAPDRDGDGLADAVDKCPAEAEVLNGVDDHDGCKDTGEVLASVSTTSVWLKHALVFEADKPSIVSDLNLRALGALAQGLKNHARIQVVEVTITVENASDVPLAERRGAWLVKHLESLRVPAKVLPLTNVARPPSVTWRVAKIFEPLPAPPPDAPPRPVDVLDEDD